MAGTDPGFGVGGAEMGLWGGGGWGFPRASRENNAEL